MEKAKEYMARCGWKEGDGLGKKGDGMKKHLGISVKEDKLGLGASAASFVPWWEQLYNDAARKAKARDEERDGDSDSEDEDEEKTATVKVAAPKPKRMVMKGGLTFVRGDTLSQKDDDKDKDKGKDTQGGDEKPKPKEAKEMEEEDGARSEEPVSTCKSTFEACGGRTGRKYGATAKLMRLKAQDEKWATASRTPSPCSYPCTPSTSPAPQQSLTPSSSSSPPPPPPPPRAQGRTLPAPACKRRRHDQGVINVIGN